MTTPPLAGVDLAKRIAALDVKIAQAKADEERAKEERANLESRLLDYMADTGIDRLTVTIDTPNEDGTTTQQKRTVSPRSETWAFPLDGDTDRAVRALKRHMPDLIKPRWNAQTISAVFREAERAIEAGQPDTIPPLVRKAFTLDRRLSIRTTKTS